MHQIKQLRFWDKVLVEIILIAYNIFYRCWRRKKLPLKKELQERFDQGKSIVLACLHQDDISLLHFYKGYPMNTLVSFSKDGSLFDRILKRFKFGTARGSSSKRGKEGYQELLKVIEKSKKPFGFLTIDGPRGPYGKSKAGIFKLAYDIQAPIIPVIAYTDRYWELKKSWSKHRVPKLFARVTCGFLEEISYELIKEKIEARKLPELQEQLDRQYAEAKSSKYYDS